MCYGVITILDILFDGAWGVYRSGFLFIDSDLANVPIQMQIGCSSLFTGLSA